MKKISVVLASLLMAVCASTPQNIAPIQTNEKHVNTEHAATSIQLTAAEIESRRLAAEKAALLEIQKQSVYFDFDQFIVKPEFLQTVQTQADFVRSNNIRMVTLEGIGDQC